MFYIVTLGKKYGFISVEDMADFEASNPCLIGSDVGRYFSGENESRFLTFEERDLYIHILYCSVGMWNEDLRIEPTAAGKELYATKF